MTGKLFTEHPCTLCGRPRFQDGGAIGLARERRCVSLANLSERGTSCGVSTSAVELAAPEGLLFLPRCPGIRRYLCQRRLRFDRPDTMSQVSREAAPVGWGHATLYRLEASLGPALIWRPDPATNGDNLDIPKERADITPNNFDGLAWLENDGTGQFSVHELTRYWGDFAVRAVDLDGDSDVDLVLSGMQLPEMYPDDEVQNLIWLENDGHQSFTQAHIGHRVATADDYHRGARHRRRGAGDTRSLAEKCG